MCASREGYEWEISFRHTVLKMSPPDAYLMLPSLQAYSTLFIQALRNCFPLKWVILEHLYISHVE